MFWNVSSCISQLVITLIIMEYSALPGPSRINLVASMAEENVINPKIFFICQEDNKVPVTSEKTGRARMKRAATICNDVVTKHIKSVIGDEEEADESGMFVYHNTNKCYKSYTHSGKLKAIEKKRATIEEPIVCVPQTLHTSVILCAPPSCNKDPRTLPCILCAKVKNKKCHDKFRICEYDSVKFIGPAKHNQDEVFTRIADRLRNNEGSSVKSFICADLY